MSRILITFGGAAYDTTIRKIAEFSTVYGADECRVYDDRWLMEQPFYELNKAWWSKRDTKYDLPNRGFGWFIWKPFVIMHALEHCKPGDVVLYVDADTYPIADLSPVFTTAQRYGIMLFEAVGCDHARWCKRDTFVVMAQDEPQWRHRPHACARFSAWKAGEWMPKQLLIEWLAYCLNPLANTFDASVLPSSEVSELCGDTEYPEFHEARCEQAILTNLAHKYGVKLYREACQAGVSQPEDQELYGQLFVQIDVAGDKLDLRGSKWRNIE